ncbi:MAG TPA: EFR1 family ferrodoxin [Kiritimatiellia bacterium]|nr:EFR1 family ferrodoxin [Kiritimatiellia bacterium]
MKAFLHFFSGTGNTARAVGIVAARLEAAGWEVARQAIAGGAEPPAGIPDLTVVAFPIWAWAPPHFVLDYVRRLPKGQGARAAVLATCGGFGAQGVGEMERALRRRGYVVVASGEAVYPDNFLLAADPPAGVELEDELAGGDQVVRLFANNCTADEPKRFRCGWGHVLWSWPIARLFRACGRRFLGKFFAADDRCTSCGQCAAACPVRAIRMEGAPARPRWNAACAGCYRCIQLCPARAIQVSVARLAIHLGVNLALTAGWVWALVAGRARLPLAAAAATAAFVALAVFQLTVLDGLLRCLETRPALRRFFAASYTKGFGRYRAPGFRAG